MDNVNQITAFLQAAEEKGELWLLEAKPGLFAMLEDGDGNSFIPVWASEEEAKSNISDDWCDYAVTTMGVDEFVDWLNELGNDGIGIALSSSNSDSALPFPAYIMKKMFKGITEKSDKDLVGEEFYDEEWADGFDELDELEDEE
ncbi:MAG TPA: DUF2750 domain-containing protein [Bacteroidetes bacterium]|nr:DUF2750 domain-containing protein [Candidatus Limimorpha avicola]